jgi:outer membrane protein assembly factor BamB
VRWTFKTGLGVVGPAAVADGRVYFGGRDGYLYVLSLADGREIWKSRPMRAIIAAPVAGPGFVCIQSFYGTTQAFESETGKELWRAALGGSVASTPVVSADAVYLATYNGVVYALR